MATVPAMTAVAKAKAEIKSDTRQAEVESWSSIVAGVVGRIRPGVRIIGIHGRRRRGRWKES